MNAVATTVDNMLTELPEDFRMLSEEQLKQIVLQTKIDEYKEQLKDHIKKTKFDMDSTVQRWLAEKAPASRRMYSLYLNNFVEYLNGTSILDVNFYTVDLFIANVLSNYGENKRRLIIASLSSFYSLLERYEYIIRNPWKGSRSKKKSIAPPVEKHIPTKEEICAIEQSFMLSDKMSLAIHILKTYGVRVGFFNKEHINYDGKILSSVSKGKYYAINVEDDQYIRDHAELLPELNSNTIQTSFRRMTKKLNIKLSPHDLRHFVACREYNKDKDIYRVSRLLKHSSVTITETYLRGLGL